MLTLVSQILTHRIPEYRLELPPLTGCNLLQPCKNFWVSLRGKLTESAHGCTMS